MFYININKELKKAKQKFPNYSNQELIKSIIEELNSKEFLTPSEMREIEDELWVRLQEVDNKIYNTK